MRVNSLGKNVKHLLDRSDEPFCFRLQRNRVFYVRFVTRPRALVYCWVVMCVCGVWGVVWSVGRGVGADVAVLVVWLGTQ